MRTRKRWSTLVAVGILSGQTACYTTRLVTPREPTTRAYVATDRQWFALGGLVPLSSPAGMECEHGLSYAESQMSGIDILINVGMTVAGTLLGASACNGSNGSDEAAAASCGATAALLIPFLIGTRTVEYACAAGPRPARRKASPPPPQEGAPPSQPPPEPLQPSQPSQPPPEPLPPGPPPQELTPPPLPPPPP